MRVNQSEIYKWFAISEEMLHAEIPEVSIQYWFIVEYIEDITYFFTNTQIALDYIKTLKIHTIKVYLHFFLISE